MVEPYFPDTPESLKADPNQKRDIHDVPPFTWQRRVLFAKVQQSADPQYLLIRDDFQGNCPPPTASFWVMANDLTFHGNQAHATGQFGVDLELYAVQPAQPRFSQWQYKNWGGERQLCIRVTQPDSTVDYAFLAPGEITFSDGAVSFTSAASYVRVSIDGLLVSLSTGGKVTAKGITLEAPSAAGIAMRGGHIDIQTNGDARSIKITGNLPAVTEVTINGQAKQ